MTLGLALIVVLVIGGFVLYRVTSDDDSSVGSSTPTQPAEQTEPQTTTAGAVFCDGLLEGEISAGWTVEESVASKVGEGPTSQQKCELHSDAGDFEIAVSEVLGTAEQLVGIESSGVQVGGNFVIGRNEELTMADDKTVAVIDNEFTDHADNRTGQANYYVMTSDTSGVSFFYNQSDSQPEDEEIDALVTSFSVPS